MNAPRALPFIFIIAFDQGGSSIPCDESLSAYCSQHSCATKVDPTNILTSYCANQTDTDIFGIAVCPDGGGFNVNKSSGPSFEYDDAGTLQAVVELSSGSEPQLHCLGGPTTFKPRTQLCLSFAIAYGCVYDAGAD